MKKEILLLLFIVLYSIGYAQQYSVTGKVTSSDDGSSMPGVSISVKGTTTGTITDIDGKYSIDVKNLNSILVFSFIGMRTEEIEFTGQGSINVQMKGEAFGLDEIIAVGYGVQKKSVVTASITKVTSDDLKNVTPSRVDNVLKGLTSGVTVTASSGQPGASSQIRIRGIGTINNSDPLFIVDGMPVDGGIDYLNPSDIQSVEILKDAASGAVYGSRAANGVILVTTKSGSKDKVNVNYSFSQGSQNPWKQRDVLNASEYAIMMNEGFLNSGKAVRYEDPYSYGEGTNWQDEVFNYNAPQINHQLNISGGTDKALYYLSAGYYSQDGIVGGNYGRSNYDRFSLRLNTTMNMMETNDREFLNKFTVGVNTAYSRIKSSGISTNSEYGSILGSAIAFSPLLGVYEEDQQAAIEQYEVKKDFTLIRNPENGMIYTIAGANYNEITNPLAQLTLPGEKGNSDKFVSSFWGELTLWDNLKFKSSLGTDLAFWGNDGWTPKYYLGQSNYANVSSVWSSMNRSLVWQLENVLSYEKSFFNMHNIQVIVGQSAKKTTGRYLGGSNRYMIEEDPNKANISFTTGTAASGDQTVYGSAYSPYTMASIFGRLSYNFDEKYMLQATVRRDGSSNFGPGMRFGIFPSLSLGWNITNETFLNDRPDWLNTMKLRASWGKNGNERIGAFGYAVLTSSGNNYAFGDNNITVYSGTKPSGLANPDLHWEESEQTNIGFDFGLLNQSLTFTVDYFDKKTNGMLMTMTLPSYVGDSKPIGNVGDMKNSGFEFETVYRLKLGELNVKFGANASYLKNELINLGNSDGFANYDYYQNVGTISRAENGLPFPYFYGYKTDGIFQTIDEVNSYLNENGELIQPKALAGDVRFVDINEDGLINDEDRTMIGKGMPDWTYGLNIAADWKGFDFSVILQGTVGNDIYDATRRTDISYINLPAYMLNRWTGEGSSNTIPRFTFSDKNNNWLSSDLFVKKGDYMRVKNVTLGYTIPSSLTQKVLISNLRLYVAAENLFTFTTYEGFDPEISSGGTSLGIDRGIYPQARTILFGVNVSF